MIIRRQYEKGKLILVEKDGIPIDLLPEIISKYPYPIANPIMSVPVNKWPMWAQALKMAAKPEDKGVGDVVARTIGSETSEAFKAFYRKVTGKDCACTGRQAKWNRLYPLNQQQPNTP